MKGLIHEPFIHPFKIKSHIRNSVCKPEVEMSGLPIARPKISECKTMMNTLVLKTRYFIEKFYRGL